MRVVVVGTSGAGKTVFSRRLSSALDVHHLELDALYWGPNWTPVPVDVFYRAVSEVTSETSWVCDGNYSGVRDLIMARGEVVIWLDYSFPVVFYRALSRTLKRLVTRESVFGGNRESFELVFNRDWIPWWVIRTFRRRRREFATLFDQPQLAHLRVMRLRKPMQAEAFLQNPQEYSLANDITRSFRR